MKYFVTIGSRVLEVELGPNGVRVDGDEVEADLAEMDGTEVRTLLLGGRSHRILAGKEGPGEWGLHLSGRRLKARVLDERRQAIHELTGMSAAGAGPGALRAPMPGLVIKVDVQEGDSVARGQGLVIVEAMKMENELKAEGDARVGKVLVTAGETVEKDQILVEFEAPESAPELGPEG
jgi:biotin carboxyl carrier protein